MLSNLSNIFYLAIVADERDYLGAAPHTTEASHGRGCVEMLPKAA